MAASSPLTAIKADGNWQMGPDAIIPAESFTSSSLNQPVRLRLEEEDAKLYPPMSIYTMFKKTKDQRPDYEALAYKLDGRWHKFTFLEYWRMCEKAAKSFIKLGLKASECVGIIGFNSPQWFLSLLGAIFAGGVGCGIYSTNAADACEYILRDSKAHIIVVENDQQLDKILKCRENGVPITRIIQYTGIVKNSHNGLVIPWSEFIDLGNDLGDAPLNARVRTLAPNKCATLIYTSGTTGNPKAAMISHDSITYLVRFIAITCLRLEPFNETFVSYLPLSHIAAQIVDLFAPLHVGCTVYFAQPDALRGSLNATLLEVRPTYFFGVPRVWEKIQEGVERVLRDVTGLRASVLEWARRAATEYTHERFHGLHKSGRSLSYALASRLVLNGVRAKLGLDRCRQFYSGAAPITKETLDFFISLGIPLAEVFGMSETTGPHTVGLGWRNRVGSVGSVRRHNLSKIASVGDDGTGELCIYGRHVFMGYMNAEAKTLAEFDADGWLCTGDLAKIEDNFLYITGRLKELIITAGGENIAPVPIEDNIKAELSKLVSNCMLIGDKRKFLTLLVTLKSKMNMETLEPLDELTNECIEYLKANGSSSTSVSHTLDKKDPIVQKLVENGIKRANDKATSRAAKVQKFIILPRDFSLANGELGPTLKLRRPIVNKIYAKQIDSMYTEGGAAAE